ncbi:hypothetical protein LTR08_004387 [Meristemomyces frigidus]|nr:hypothetical protein LTR08_004387 [Meristemomyces frigidus]
MSYDYKIAKDVLSDTDKNRLLCLYLSCQTAAVNGCVDWDKAAAMFDCASVDSMKVMTRTILKKVEKAGGKEGVDATAAASEKGGGKKRKGKAGEEADAGGEETPKKKARGRPKKKAVTPVEDDVEEAEGAGVVKAEDED